jgi:hypothetical protein
LKIDWKRYLLIISYFVLYWPQVLSYKLYVSPSSFYKEEFHATKLNKRISQLRTFITRKTIPNTLNNVQANKWQNHKDFSNPLCFLPYKLSRNLIIFSRIYDKNSTKDIIS